MSFLSKVDSTSVKTKLAVSNIMMLLIPIIVIGIVAAVIISGVSYTSSSEDGPQTELSEALGVFYLWKLQKSASGIESEISKSGGYSDANDALKDEILSLENSNKANAVAIFTNENCVYTTSGYTVEEINQIYDVITGSSEFSNNSLLCANEEGMSFVNTIVTDDESKVSIVVVNPKMKNIVDSNILRVLFNPDGTEGNMTLLFLLTAVVILILTNITLVFWLSRSILDPINAISEAANEIQTGNLDYEINYHSKNEMGRACEDIDNMRIRLKESVEKQQSYEENRKAMVMGISHDLATPLTSIKGYALGIMDGIADTPEKAEKYIKTIYASACDMDKLVDELFTYSKLDLGNVPFYFDKLDMITFFEDLCPEFEVFFNQNDLDFVFDNQCGKGICCSVDKNQLEKVIRNVAGNSVKYKKPGRGKFTITLSLTEDRELLVKLADEGQGVEEKVLERLFDSFFRTDKARSGPSKGSGLGLAIVKSIIERHKGGKIWAESSLGNGLAILFTLPVVDIIGKDEKNGEEDTNR